MASGTICGSTQKGQSEDFDSTVGPSAQLFCKLVEGLDLQLQLGDMVLVGRESKICVWTMVKDNKESRTLFFLDTGKRLKDRRLRNNLRHSLDKNLHLCGLFTSVTWEAESRLFRPDVCVSYIDLVEDLIRAPVTSEVQVVFSRGKRTQSDLIKMIFTMSMVKDVHQELDWEVLLMSNFPSHASRSRKVKTHLPNTHQNVGMIELLMMAYLSKIPLLALQDHSPPATGTCTELARS
jgi:hypothetical protein